MTNDAIASHIVATWSQLLGVKQIAADDNFFALGGHSLLGVKLIGALQDKLGLGEELKIGDLFQYPSLGEFTAHVQSLAAPSEETGEI
jgi:acyl carrier protein